MTFGGTYQGDKTMSSSSQKEFETNSVLWLSATLTLAIFSIVAICAGRDATAIAFAVLASSTARVYCEYI